MHMAPRAAAWVAWAVWTCNTPQQGMRSKESGLRSALFFAQSRLTTGHWKIQYHALFANAWRNKLMLAEAALFTGLFWLLLFLRPMLFHTLGIDYFRELVRGGGRGFILPKS
jgi:hypothetical protein